MVSFIVEIWPEKTWEGRIEHVQTNKCEFFTTKDEVVKFIEDRMTTI